MTQRVDATILRLSAAAAVLIHVLALWLPVRFSGPELPPDPIRCPIEARVFPIPPPDLEPPAPANLEPIARRVPLPTAEPTDRDLEPLPAAVEIDVAEQPAWDDAGPDLSAPVPPAVPDLVPEWTDGLVLPVRLEGSPDPVYPRMAIAARREGKVILSAVINVRGEVERIRILRAPEPDFGFSSAAVEAVERWRYEPGTLRGDRVAVELTVVVDFTLH
jgi:protein TonB